ncbi:hypothetical protein BASA60_006183 [Batrachochytrium salamandrivorans]|nr:hypothetical protein BASA60_006183 [Batrachochytrium salamandrivorans]
MSTALSSSTLAMPVPTPAGTSIHSRSHSGSPPVEPETTISEYRAYWVYGAALAAAGGIGRLIGMLLLEDLARGAGVYERSNVSCSSPSPVNGTTPMCVLPIGGSYINTINFLGFVATVAIIVQVFLVLLVAGYGDHSFYRRHFLIGTGIIGAISSILIPLAYTPYLYWLAGLLLIITSSFQAFSTVFIESYFPILLRNDPSVKHYRMPAKFDGDPTSTSARSTSKELGRQVTESGMIIQSTVLKTYPFDERGNWVQMYSNIYGFSTSFVILTIGGGLINVLGNGIGIKEGVICFTGVLWLGLGVLTVLYLKPHPGPALPGGRHPIFFSWKKAMFSFKKWKKVEHTFRFLLAYFFFGGGMNTLGIISVLYLGSNLHLTDFQTLTIGNLLPVFAILGSLACISAQNKFHISTHTMLMVSVAMFGLIPIYALIGAFNTKFGLVHAYEAYILSAWGGFFYGAAISFSKVTFAELIPRGNECEFFGYYVLTDRVSTWFSSVLIGLIANGSGVRYGLIWLIVFFIISIPILWVVDVEQGRQDALLMAKGAHDDVVLMDNYTSDAFYQGRFSDDIPTDGSMDKTELTHPPSETPSVQQPYHAEPTRLKDEPVHAVTSGTLEGYPSSGTISRATTYSPTVASATATRPPPSNYGTAGGSSRATAVGGSSMLSQSVATTSQEAVSPMPPPSSSYIQMELPSILPEHTSSSRFSGIPHLEQSHPSH